MAASGCSPRARPQQGRMQGPAAAVLWLLPLLALPHHSVLGYSIHVSSSAKAAVAHAVEHTDRSLNVLDQMSDGEKRAWAHDPGLTINETLNELRSPKVHLVVNVKLVGFHGEGNMGLRLQEHDLLAYLKTLHSELATVVLHPEPQHLNIKPELEFRVTPVYYELAQHITDAITQGIHAHAGSDAHTDYPLHLIPHGDVDNLIAQDYIQGDTSAYTLYILNPNTAHLGPYAYAYDVTGEGCPGPLWVSDHGRYAWFDLSANITFYGPGPGGKGQVFDHSVPLLRHYKQTSLAKALLPDLAALVWSFCQHLVWPPLHHSKVVGAPTVTVQIIYMHQSLQQPPSRLDTEILRNTLQLAVGHAQRIRVLEHWLPFGECDHCMAAYSGALRIRTARSPKSWRMDTMQFIDSELLQPWMNTWGDIITAGAGVDKETNDQHVLPVYVFDLTSEREPILLDGWRQAAALDNGAVVAVHTAAKQQVPTFFGCMDHQVKLDPSSIQRPITAAVLQAGWGVSETAVHYSAGTGRGWSFLWSLGAAPFGPLSVNSGISFAQRDAMLRNMALLVANATLSHAVGLMEGFARLTNPNDRVKRYLLPSQIIPYNQHMNLLLFKLQRATTAISSLEFSKGLAFAMHMIHDTTALHAIMHKLKSILNFDLVCAGANRHRVWWLLPAGSGLVLLMALVWRVMAGVGSSESKRSKGF